MHQMRLRNDIDAWGSWQAYASTTNMSWELKDADGPRTVSAEFSDSAGNIRTVSDDIILDRFEPIVSTFVINNDNAWTNSRNVTLATAASDSGSGLEGMRFRNPPSPFGTWQPFSATCGWQLKDADGDNFTVDAEIRDAVGHVTSKASDNSIGLDRVIPIISSFMIDGGAGTTTSIVVDLSITATDDRSGMSEMRFSNDGWNWGSWETYAATRDDWLLDLGIGLPGTKWVYIEVRDHAGNMTSGSDSIFYSW